jgi:hypothetical protein
VLDCLPVSILRLINHEAVSENRKLFQTKVYNYNLFKKGKYSFPSDGLDFYETTRNQCPIFPNKLSPIKTEIRCIVPKTTSVKPCRSNYPVLRLINHEAVSENRKLFQTKVYNYNLFKKGKYSL